jgi:hypothetical protein
MIYSFIIIFIVNMDLNSINRDIPERKLTPLEEIIANPNLVDPRQAEKIREINQFVQSLNLSEGANVAHISQEFPHRTLWNGLNFEEENIYEDINIEVMKTTTYSRFCWDRVFYDNNFRTHIYQSNKNTLVQLIDISRQLKEISPEKYGLVVQSPGEGLFEATDLKAKSIDLIFLGNTLDSVAMWHNDRSSNLILNEIRRTLKTGGYLITNGYNLTSRDNTRMPQRMKEFQTLLSPRELILVKEAKTTRVFDKEHTWDWNVFKIVDRTK